MISYKPEVSVLSIEPYFLCMIGWLFSISAILKWFPTLNTVYSIQPTHATLGSDHKFNLPLDSLRGYLAISVLFHHATILFYYWQSGVWELPDSRFYSFIGSVAVNLFFILSGYLFWTKALADRGIRDVWKFWVGRCRRILPAYYVLVLFLIAYCFAHESFHLNGRIRFILRDILSWLLVGVAPAFTPINGVVPTVPVCAGVVWTLRLEMMFYILMPLIGLFATKSRMWIIIIASVAIDVYASTHSELTGSTVAAYLLDFNHYFALGFAFGFIAAFVEQTIDLRIRKMLKSRFSAVLGLGAVVMSFTLPITHYTYWESGILLIFFVIVAARNDLFGVLRLPASQWLGRVSYDIYLFHGFVLFITSLVLNKYIKPFAVITPAEFWIFVGVCGVITMVLSGIVYAFIERRFVGARKVDSTLSAAHPI